MTENTTKGSQVQGIATLLVLNDEIRKISSIREFGFYTTNETHHLIAYHTAYLWEPKAITGVEIIAQSGTAEIDPHAPANLWLVDTIKRILSHDNANTIHSIHAGVSKSDMLGADLNLYAINPHDEFAENILWCPFLNKANAIVGGLIIFRETPFNQDEIKMITWLIASYQYTWLTLQKTTRTMLLKKLKDKPYIIGMLVILAVICLFPTRLTVFGTGSVTPKDPILINAPMQGVIKSFAVSPGDKVKAGQLLLLMDQSDLLAQLEVNKRDYLLTQTRLRSAVNEGFDGKDSHSDVPLLRAQLDIDRAHFDYTSSLLAKTEIKSPTDGIVIFDSKEDLVGQPVQTGERILVVANPKSVELKVTIPVANFMQINVGDAGKFFLYGQLSALPIKVRTLGYNAVIQPNKSLAYNFVADFTDKSANPELGGQGNVEIYSARVPFIYYIFRRPLHSLRRALGL